MTQAQRVLLREKMRAFTELWRRHQATGFGPQNRVKITFEVIREFEELSSQLYRVRAALAPSDPFRIEVEDLVANISHDILFYAKHPKEEGTYSKWVARYRDIWRRNFPLFLLTCLISIAASFVGWHVTVQEPDFAALFVGQGLMENVLEKNKWFASAGESPLLMGLMIAKNNIQVSIYGYVGGAALGLGGLYILMVNFLMLGSVLAFCYLNGFDTALTDFVIGHGPLELTIIAASVFAGFLFGRVFYMRPYSQFRARMAQAGGESAAVLMGILPWLVVAAAVETFISPLPEISFALKFFGGLAVAAAFWLWTFFDLDRHRVAE